MAGFFIIMRMSHDDIYAQFLSNTGSQDSTGLQAIFHRELGQTYQLMLAKLKNYKTQMIGTFTTVSGKDQTYDYPYPVGMVDIDGAYITIGAVNFPLKVLNAEYNWEQLNAIQIQASALPQFLFPRRDGFGVWPLPQAAYTGTIIYHYRDRNLSVADYSIGTVQVQIGASATAIVGTNTVWTAAMVGRWFTVTDTTLAGQGYWYRISAYTGAGALTLYQGWAGTASASTTYRICETPEIPEEGHMTLCDGVTAGYYAHVRKDVTASSQFYNLFWTGDINNPSRQEGNSKISGGLIGLMNRYANRQDERIIIRKPKLNPLQYKVWATTLS